MTADATRLVASTGATAEGVRPGLGHPRCCLECGAGHVPRLAIGEFCSTACRKAWNNRRLVRGAELYDLFMALRWERAVATGLHVFSALSRMAAGFRRKDAEQRDGRRSWSSPARIIDRRPYLRAERLKPSKIDTVSNRVRRP